MTGYSWQLVKAAKTLRERGLSFDDACIVLENDEATLVAEDNRRDYGEIRLVAIGPLADRLVVIVYTERARIKHIISMRKANHREKTRYQKRLGAR